MNLAMRKYLDRRPRGGYWYRSVPARFHHMALDFGPSVDTPSRFNPGRTDRPGFPVLYFADDPTVVLFEVHVLAGSLLPGQPAVPNPAAGSRALVHVRARLSGVIDLTDPAQVELWDTSFQELTGDWLGYRHRSHRGPYPPLAPTQRLGAALYRMPRVEGFVTHSAKAPARVNLVVFPTKLRPGSAIEVVDPDPMIVEVLQRLP